MMVGDRQQEGLFGYVKRVLLGFVNRRVWQSIVASLTSCYAQPEYRQLKRTRSDSIIGSHHAHDIPASTSTSTSTSTPSPLAQSRGLQNSAAVQDSENSVIVKITVLGDSETGKTTFISKYVTDSIGSDYVQTAGVFSMGKVFEIQNTRIALTIWELGGACQSSNLLAQVCQDSAAVLIMFDLTRRSTLNSVKDWFLQARQQNKVFLLIIVGNKYDQFVQMPQDIQSAITRQARFYAQVMGASLFFSSITHNINVHKIFKVLVAKLFDLPCSISQNVNFSEPIVEY